MFAHHGLRAPATRRRVLHGLSPALFCLLLLAGCTAAPPAPVNALHPADPEAGARAASYRPVVGPYTSQRPREPGGWRENNERVAPQEKP